MTRPGARPANAHNFNTDRLIPMITVQLPTDPTSWGCFWGSDYEQAIARANDNLEAMIRSEFADAPFELHFERTATPMPRGVIGHDEDAVEAVFEFIATNWTNAL